MSRAGIGRPGTRPGSARSSAPRPRRRGTGRDRPSAVPSRRARTACTSSSACLRSAGSPSRGDSRPRGRRWARWPRSGRSAASSTAARRSAGRSVGLRRAVGRAQRCAVLAFVSRCTDTRLRSSASGPLRPPDHVDQRVRIGVPRRRKPEREEHAQEARAHEHVSELAGSASARARPVPCRVRQRGHRLPAKATTRFAYASANAGSRCSSPAFRYEPARERVRVEAHDTSRVLDEARVHVLAWARSKRSATPPRNAGTRR